MNSTEDPDRQAFRALLQSQLMWLTSLDDELPDAATPIGRATRDFFAANWERARTGLLTRTTKLRVQAQRSPAPRVFHFEVDCAYKRKAGVDALVEHVEAHSGAPLRGTIRYRPDLYTAPRGEPSLTVFIDRAQGLYHPNYSRAHGVLCVGDLPPGPFPLDDLLEHLYRILSYQNVATSSPADIEAAQYFERDADAMRGLETVEPLYS